MTSPSIKLTASAANALREALLSAAPQERIRIEISSTFHYDLSIGPTAENDVLCEVSGIPFCFDRESASRAEGLSMDFVDGSSGGFRIESPLEPPRVRALSAVELDGLRKRRTPHVLFDVRTEQERSIALIEGAVWFDTEARRTLETLPKDTMLVFQCHHGIRSRAAAEMALSLGFTTVYNLTGGIEAWSLAVDPSVPRY